MPVPLGIHKKQNKRTDTPYTIRTLRRAHRYKEFFVDEGYQTMYNKYDCSNIRVWKGKEIEWQKGQSG